MERVCARQMPGNLKDWECDECQQEAERARVEQEFADERLTREEDRILDTLRFKNLKPCPGCGIMTDRISGCNHVQCVVADCQIHWCFACGQPFKENEIYPHMREHGGPWADMDYD